MRSLGKNLVCVSVFVALTRTPTGTAEPPQTQFQRLATLVYPRSYSVDKLCQARCLV